MGAPPATVDTTRPAELEEGSKRDFAEYRANSPVCGGCHRQFDPLGYGFEPFDGIGQYQAIDEHGNATRMDGSLPDPEDPQTYTNLDEYMTLLASSARVDTCLVRKPLQFQIGRELEASDECIVDDLQRALNQADGSYPELVVAIARHPAFVFVRSETMEAMP